MTLKADEKYVPAMGGVLFLFIFYTPFPVAWLALAIKEIIAV